MPQLTGFSHVDGRGPNTESSAFARPLTGLEVEQLGMEAAATWDAANASHDAGPSVQVSDMGNKDPST